MKKRNKEMERSCVTFILFIKKLANREPQILANGGNAARKVRDATDACGAAGRVRDVGELVCGGKYICRGCGWRAERARIGGRGD
jgi:hypothetical protein